ncbi:MAG TPA: alpha/beta fold hydrolase [Gammaproteobacteria bacterium]|nr:alpha/beta fold hydrolase [Gammaproteobacteria bacterium]
MTAMLLLALAGGALVLSAPLLARPLLRTAFRAPRRRERHDPGALDLPFREVRFATARERRLFGWYLPPPDGAPAPAVAMLHGWGGNAECMLPLAPALHRAGFALLLFDARCHGRSDGDDFASLPRFAEDLEHAVDWLKANPDVDAGRLAVLGHSVGGAAALLAASRRQDIGAVVSLAAFADPHALMDRMLATKGIRYAPLRRWLLHEVERAIGARFADIAPVTTVRAVRRPVLLVHGLEDRTVPPADAERIRAAGGDRVHLLSVPGAHHLASGAIADQAPAVVGFLEEALPAPEPADAFLSS